MNLSHIKAVIFDLDGTLVDSRLDFDQLRQQLGFPQGEPILEYIEQMTCEKEQELAHKIVSDFEISAAHTADLMPGALELINALHRLGYPTAILTRNIKQASQMMLENLGLPIDLLLTREDCEPKPSPEGLFIIADKLGLPTRDLIYVGDYKFDLDTAKNANMLSCLFDREGNSPYQEEADVVIRDLEQLLPMLRFQI
ncbi:HAD family hydrolase [Vibrio genomosp. F10]|uniref:Phosphatase n=1 Tax=Vibrio genomosp. F10 TaxID=723171 RepID=A0A1B9QVI6_9VIBR|nr:HAD family hydrolase [Vibrio genomosp. F10]OCH72965.1 phosphatase [Vibrio genomosp. F10]OEF06510.1 phosphatase [Vibrio genomosp. F10 str. 9ZB36]